MAREPWAEQIYEKEGEMRRTRKRVSSIMANQILTILVVFFFVVITGLFSLFIYLSTGGSDTKVAKEGFYSSNASESVEGKSFVSSLESNSKSDVTASDEIEMSDSNSGVLTVQPGEGVASIAQRAGISIAQLEALNPDHMITGSWYANPGDVVKTR